MTVLIPVTAEHIAEAETAPEYRRWCAPIEDAIADALVPEPNVDVDFSDDGARYIATLAASGWWLTFDLPPEVNEWLNERYGSTELDGTPVMTGKPFTFVLEPPAWLVALVKA